MCVCVCTYIHVCVYMYVYIHTYMVVLYVVYDGAPARKSDVDGGFSKAMYLRFGNSKFAASRAPSPGRPVPAGKECTRRAAALGAESAAPSSSPSRARPPPIFLAIPGAEPTGAVLRNLSTPSFMIGSATRCIAMLCNERVGFECRGRASLRCISLRCNALRMRAIIVATARSVCCEARTASDVAARAPARPSAAPRVMSAPPVAILAKGQRALPQGDLRAREGNFAAATAQGSGPGGGRRR